LCNFDKFSFCFVFFSKQNAYDIFIGKPEMQRAFRRPRSIWENNITVDLTEIEWEGRN
jgi:hypothetical protein